MKPDLLLLHGALGTKEQFNNLKEKLSTEFTVHYFDFEGHGEKASLETFTMTLFAKNVIDYLNEHHIEKTNIFGYSMGGYVALNIAKLKPALVEKIVTLGTKFDWTEETAAKEIRMLNPEKIAEKVPAFASQLASIHTKNDWKEVVRKTAQMMHGLGRTEKLTEIELSEIQHEVLIGIGDKDRMVSIEESEKSANTLPHGRLKIIEGFSHSIDKVDQEKLKLTILNFVKN